VKALIKLKTDRISPFTPISQDFALPKVGGNCSRTQTCVQVWGEHLCNGKKWYSSEDKHWL